MHIVLNTIPGIGIGLAVTAMIYGMARRADEVVRFALLVMTAVAILTIGVFFSGKRAIDVVGKVPGVILPNIEEHERAGKRAFIAVEIAGTCALAAFIWSVRSSGTPRGVTLAVTMILLAAFGVVIHTSILGGRIHHPEAGGRQITIELPAESPRSP